MANVGFGIIGLGYFGKNYLRLLRELPQAKLLAQASRSQGSVEEVMQHPAIDAICIVSPPETHFDLAQKALLAGKHVLVEKPMVLSLAEAEELARTVQKTGKILMVGHQYLYNDHIIFLKEQIARGRLGEIKAMFAEHGYWGPSPDIDILWDAATHVYALADYLFDGAVIKKVSGQGSRDIIAFQANLENSILFNYAGNRLIPKPKKVRHFRVFGSKGFAAYDEYEYPEKLRIFIGEEIVRLSHEAGEPLKNELQYFIKCIKEKNVPLTDIEHGLRVTKALDFISKNLV